MNPGIPSAGIGNGGHCPWPSRSFLLFKLKILSSYQISTKYASWGYLSWYIKWGSLTETFKVIWPFWIKKWHSMSLSYTDQGRPRGVTHPNVLLFLYCNKKDSDWLQSWEIFHSTLSTVHDSPCDCKSIFCLHLLHHETLQWHSVIQFSFHQWLALSESQARCILCCRYQLWSELLRPGLCLGQFVRYGIQYGTFWFIFCQMPTTPRADMMQILRLHFSFCLTILVLSLHSAILLLACTRCGVNC